MFQILTFVNSYEPTTNDVGSFDQLDPDTNKQLNVCVNRNKLMLSMINDLQFHYSLSFVNQTWYNKAMENKETCSWGYNNREAAAKLNQLPLDYMPEEPLPVRKDLFHVGWIFSLDSTSL